MTVAGEETIELTLLAIKTIELELQNSLDLAMALKPLLMSQSELGEGHQGQQETHGLERKAKACKGHFLTGDGSR